MFDWDAIRAYFSLTLLTSVAMLAIWKDSKDYKKRAHEEEIGGRWKPLKRHAVTILYAVTFTTFILGAMDIHSSRIEAAKQKSNAQSESKADRAQVKELQARVNAGNLLLGQQRKDFLKEFDEMKERVGQLQTEVKTSDLQKEASQLRSDLDATRASLEVRRATLSFALLDPSGKQTNWIVKNVEDGVVKVPFTVNNNTDSDALEGSIIFYGCDACKISSTPPGFSRLNGEPDNRLNYDFQHVFARTSLPDMEISIVPPPNVDQFQVGISYRCRTCKLPNERRGLSSSDLGTVMLGPHWRPKAQSLGRIGKLLK